MEEISINLYAIIGEKDVQIAALRAQLDAANQRIEKLQTAPPTGATEQPTEEC